MQGLHSGEKQGTRRAGRLRLVQLLQGLKLDAARSRGGPRVAMVQCNCHGKMGGARWEASQKARAHKEGEGS